MTAPSGPPRDVPSVLSRLARPKRAVVTAGMPYANGPLHIGHLAGCHLPADIHARWLGLLIGREHVLYVCGSDDHGSTSEVAALRAGMEVRELVDSMHTRQAETLRRYAIDLDVYSGTSRPECAGVQTELCQDFVRRLYDKGLLYKRASRQWYDPKMQRFLPDRLVRGRCPNPKCDNDAAYSDECDACGHQHEPEALLEPRSALSDATPEMRETVHLWLDMWQVSDTLRAWIKSKSKGWRPLVTGQALDVSQPALRLAREREQDYKAFKDQLPKHKRRYAAGGQVMLCFESKTELQAAREELAHRGLETELSDEWAHRPISRDIAWGIPLPAIDEQLAGKTLYVWPDSLLAPISFSKLALEGKGIDAARYADYWCDPDARIYQFIGQDNVYFYVLMQGAMWLGMQKDPHRLPEPGELQLTDVMGCFHLLVGGHKMSKSRGNFLICDELLERGYETDQIRYYLSLLGLPERQSDFDFDKLDERNKFLAGPMNSAFERPISAAHSKFDGRVPDGELIEGVEADTVRMVQRYVRAMERASYPSMLFELENYARKINSLFTRYKPHDDRHPERGRKDALFSSFYVLKNLMIMLYPFVPDTMQRLRESLRLPADVWRLDELGTPIAAGHALGPKQTYFPAGSD